MESRIFQSNKKIVYSLAYFTALTITAYLIDLIPIYERVVDKNDLAISKPHVDDHIKYRSVLILFCYIFPLLLLIHRGKVKLTILILLHLGIAQMVTTDITNLLKALFGRLRPDYLGRVAVIVKDPNVYKKLVKEGRRSFPSGHTATSFCTIGFIVSNCVKSSHTENARIPCIIVNGILIIIGAIVGFSRYIDNRHHISDILVGGFIGLLAGVVSCKLHHRIKNSGS